MLYKLWRAVWKEILLLKRDVGGLIIIFIMPLVLIITVTLIQDSTFKNYEETKVPVIFVDNDKGDVSKLIVEQVKKNKSLDLISGKHDENSAKNAVFGGEYQLAIILPENLSNDLNASINSKVETILSSLGYSEATSDSTQTAAQTLKPASAKEIHFYFDPATSVYFKNDVQNTIDKIIVNIENQKIYAAFKDQLGSEVSMSDDKFITYKEILPVKDKKDIKPNSVQHNVPAWALVAMFFICIPLSVNLVKEKNQGTVIRVLSSPTPYFIHVLGKTFTYLLICIIQFLMMLAIGIYLFPYLGLPALEISGQLGKLLFVTVFAGLAAIGFGILIGTIAETQEQGAPFGATAVIVLAALGGIFVPVFLMPEIMQKIAEFSPLNWGLQAYHSIILRGNSILTVIPQAALLLLFYFITVTIALIYERRHHSL